MIARLRNSDAAGWVPVLVALLVLLPGIAWGLPTARDGDSTFPWGYDEQAPLPPLSEAQAKFARGEGKYLAYPLFHYIVLTASYLPYITYEYLTGDFRPTGTFPYGMKHPAATCGALTLIARGVTVLMAMGCVWFLYRIARMIGVELRVASAASVAVALMPTFVYYGRTSNFDVPYIFWTLAALHATASIVFAGRFGTWAFVRFGVFSAFAVATKDQAYAFLVGLPPLLLLALASGPYREVPAKQRILAVLLHRPLWLGFLASLVAFAFANNLIFGWDGFMAHVKQALSMSHDDRKWNATPDGQLGLLGETFVQIGATVGPLVLLAFIGVFRLERDHRWMVLAFCLLPIVTHHVLVLTKILYSHPRFMLLPSMLVILIAACGYGRDWVRNTIAILGFAYLAFMAFDMTRAQLADARYDAQTFFAEQAKAGDTVETYARFSRLLPALPDGVNLTLVPAAEISREKLKRRKPEFILVTDLSEQSVLSRPETKPFADDLHAGKLGYRSVLERETPSLMGRWFVRGLAPKVTVLQRESKP